MNTIDVSLICKILGDYNRLQIIEMLAGDEKCACDLLESFNIAQPTLSHHMRILCECGMVRNRKSGKWTYYSLNNDTFENLIYFLNNINSTNVISNEINKCCIEDERCKCNELC